jgi:hypothetical protein
MSLISKIRSLLYGSAKVLGDASAVKEGKVGKRVRNRLVGRLAGKLLQKILK